MAKKPPMEPDADDKKKMKKKKKAPKKPMPFPKGY